MIYVEGTLIEFRTFADREIHNGARALLDINFLWFGYIARLSQWGEWGYFFNCSTDFYLPSFRKQQQQQKSNHLSYIIF
jgi:hypothetical protein